MQYYIALLKDNNLKLHVELFRQRYNYYFWNSIWYFQLKDLNFDFLLPYENDVRTGISINNSLSIDTRVSTLGITNPYNVSLNYNSDDEKLVKQGKHSKTTVSSEFALLGPSMDNFSPVNMSKKLDFTEIDKMIGNVGSSKFINPTLILDVSQEKISENSPQDNISSSSVKKNRSSTEVMKKLDLTKKIALLNIIREESESHHYGSDNSRVVTEMHMDILEDDEDLPATKEKVYSARRMFKSMDKAEN